MFKKEAGDFAIKIAKAAQVYVKEEIKAQAADLEKLPAGDTKLLPRDNALRELEDTIGAGISELFSKIVAN